MADEKPKASIHPSIYAEAEAFRKGETQGDVTVSKKKEKGQADEPAPRD